MLWIQCLVLMGCGQLGESRPVSGCPQQCLSHLLDTDPPLWAGTDVRWSPSHPNLLATATAAWDAQQEGSSDGQVCNSRGGFCK